MTDKELQEKIVDLVFELFPQGSDTDRRALVLTALDVALTKHRKRVEHALSKIRSIEHDEDFSR